MSGIPQEILGDALANVRAGRVVKAAVFTTFTFDPGFFELHILPLIFDRMSQVDKVKRLQLEDLLRSVDVAVYYDRSGLSQDALPSHANFRRIDVRRQDKGLFHQKLVLMLVEDPGYDEELGADDESPPLSLIVGALSANLTRSGWWENVETGHFEEIKDVDVDGSRIPYRRDLLAAVRRLRNLAPDDDHVALDRIHEFLLSRTNRDTMTVNRYGGRYYTRLFVGQKSLPRWLLDIGVGGDAWNLEVVSPFFDSGQAGTLETLMEATSPKEVRVFLPTGADGVATVDKGLYDAVEELAHWSSFPSHITRPAGRAASDAVASRRVHAKVYRYWRSDGLEVVLTGSVNLTGPAHSHAAAGNLEAAFLVDRGDGGRKSWWLLPIEKAPTEFLEEPESEDDDAQVVIVDVSFRYDWSSEELSYRIESDATGALHVSELGGKRLFTVDQPKPGSWRPCGTKASEAVRTLLDSSSFLEVRSGKGMWRVLVREEGMVHRPSLIADLTPEEILLYWSLLSEEQKEAFLERKLEAEAQLQGIVTTTAAPLIAGDTIFDRFAGVYHAFGRLEIHVDRAIERGDDREAEARLFGMQYDSLPVLLQRLVDRQPEDPVLTYTTFLCAIQLRDQLKHRHRQFWGKHRGVRKQLEDLLKQISGIRRAVLPDEPDRDKFLEWYERMFMRRIALPEEDT